MKAIIRRLFASLAVIFFILALYDAHIHHADTLFDRPYIWVEMVCAGVCIILAGASK